MEIEINGIKYVQIEKNTSQPNKKVSKFLLMAMAFSAFDPYNNTAQKEHPKVDLISEFERIEQKKSKLSRSQREWVVWKFNQNFKKVEL